MINKREQDALTAYFRFLQGKGATGDSLEKREKALSQLDIHIAGITNDGASYREAVDNCLAYIDKSERGAYLHIMREYFSFWSGNHKLLATASSEADTHPDAHQWQALPGSLQDIWATLDDTQFPQADAAALEAYRQSLQANELKPAAMDTRIKLAKLLLIRLKDAASRSANPYRKAADTIAPLFELKQTRTLFFLVVREFYYFWMGDENAAEYISRESTKQKYK
jgi:hypothetical protein